MFRPASRPGESSPHELLERKALLGWEEGEYNKPFTVPDWEDIDLSNE